MSKNLVIVESPAKAKTIKKYLGNDFEVMASYGHVRDLVPKEGAVDTDHGFEMRYEVIEKNEKHVKSIEKALKKADALYLATALYLYASIVIHLQSVFQSSHVKEKSQVQSYTANSTVWLT